MVEGVSQVHRSRLFTKRQRDGRNIDRASLDQGNPIEFRLG
jgi:hypothetical protein